MSYPTAMELLERELKSLEKQVQDLEEEQIKCTETDARKAIRKEQQPLKTNLKRIQKEYNHQKKLKQQESK